MLEVIINKVKNTKFQPVVSTLLIYNIPLVCLLIPYSFKYIMVVFMQLVMSYVSMRLFDDANESSRSRYLKIQFWISLIGMIVAYFYGKNIGITFTSELVMIIASLLIQLPSLAGISCAVLYVVINICMCGCGILLGVLLELAKENQYLL